MSGCSLERREHLVELQTVYGFQPFNVRHYRPAVHGLRWLAWQTDRGLVLAGALVEPLRGQSVLLPTLSVIECLCAEAIAEANRRLYRNLTAALYRSRGRPDDDAQPGRVRGLAALTPRWWPSLRRARPR